MAEKKQRNFFIKTLLILICVFIVVIFAVLFTDMYPCWKLFSKTINNKQFDSIAQENSDFVGMNIEDVLSLVTKNNECYVFSQTSICMGMTYKDIITIWPEMELAPPRYKLYCVAVCSSMASEEIYPRGFFINKDDIVIEPYILLSIY